MSKKGFIAIQRKMFDNFLWNETRVFSRAEAWIDLIQSARFEATQEVIQNKVVEVQRGELPASRRYLEKRWNWGSSKVGGFITNLEELGMLNQRQTKGQTMLSLCKYNDYQDIQTKDISESEPSANHRRTTSEPTMNHERTTSKPNINNIRKLKRVGSLWKRTSKNPR